MSDARLFKLVGVVSGAVLVLLVFDTWRVNRALSQRASRRDQIVNITGIRG